MQDRLEIHGQACDSGHGFTASVSVFCHRTSINERSTTGSLHGNATAVAAGGEERKAPAARPPPRRQVVSDPVESAQAAGLRYVSDTMPGIRRKKAGKGFTYVGAGRQDHPGSRRSWPGSARWPFRPPTPTSGSVPAPTATSRRPAGMPAAGSSIATIPDGGRCGTRPSSAGCWPSARCCRGSGSGWSAT